MASLLRKEGSKYWFVAYRDAAGRQHRKSTATTDRKKAERIAQTYQELHQRKIKPHRVRETIAAIVREVYGEDVPSATVRQFITEWLKTKRPEVTAGTLRSYEKSARKFLEYLGSAADSDIANIRKASIAGFRNQLHQVLAPVTVNIDLQFVKSVFRAAKRDGYSLEDPAEFVDAVRASKTNIRRAFTVDELRAVMEIADPEWQSLMRFGLYTGQRLADLANLTWNNIDLDREVIRFTARKTDRVTLIPIADPLRAHIESLPASDNPRDPLHPKLFGRPSNQLSNQFVELLVAVGLHRPHAARKKTSQGRSVRRMASELSFHSLRHTAVSLLKDAGIPQAVVQELIGHRSAQMSALYTHVGQEALRKATSALPAL